MATVNDGGNNFLQGSALADTINGFGGNDTLVGFGGLDVLDGSVGTDTVDYSASGAAVFIDLVNGTTDGGDAEGDTLVSIENFIGSGLDDGFFADNGSNTIFGGAGNDFVLANGGNDVIVGGAGGDTISGGDGADIASYEGSNVGVVVNLLTGNTGGGDATGDILSSIENLRGSSFGDTFIGDNGDNRIEGGGGDDIIDGLGGNDVLIGDAGVDSLSGGDNNDFLVGGTGSDLLSGGAGIDAADYSGSAAGVTVKLDGGFGNAGFGAGGDAEGDVLGSIENLQGSNHADILEGDALGNAMNGLNGDDTLRGLSGDDILAGQIGADTIDGGDGVDTAAYDSSGAGVNVSLLLAIAQGGDAQGDTLIGIENINGSGFADVISGDGADNRLLGLSGSDELSGFSGNDRLEGGAGIDRLSGGDGDDILIGGADGDDLFGDEDSDLLVGGSGADHLDGGQGIDVADYSGSSAAIILSLSSNTTTTRANDLATLGASGGDAEGDVLDNIEQVQGSVFDDDIEGDARSNKLNGGDGSDLLKGEDGGDTLDGGAGNDILVGGQGNDLYIVTQADNVSEVAGEGSADRVAALESFILDGGDDIEILSTTNTKFDAAINLTGNKLKQEILGNAGANILHTGGGAADVMKGFLGNDTYRVLNSADVVVETAKNGSDKVVAAVDYRLGTGVHVEILQTNGSAGTSSIDLTGNEFGQQITGNAGANRIEGKGGIDTLRGGSGADTFVFASTLGAANVDKIVDFNVPADRMLLSDAIFSALDTGTLSATAFRANETGLAQDSTDHIIYERDTGKLFYDADGLGGWAGVHFATLTVGLALTNADFAVA
ncbi:calcium-binding protein [Mesorhizobium sp. IMUNJ 23232]|uniref:calcium-binding protein n=1 Tax=Mesorhizobium sp. IMUNJ 23232 TaxID=3376064 RepID=UPI0037B4337B